MPEETLMYCHLKNYKINNKINYKISVCLEHYIAQNFADTEIHIANRNSSVIVSKLLNFKHTAIKIIDNFYES